MTPEREAKNSALVAELCRMFAESAYPCLSSQDVEEVVSAARDLLAEVYRLRSVNGMRRVEYDILLADVQCLRAELARARDEIDAMRPVAPPADPVAPPADEDPEDLATTVRSMGLSVRSENGLYYAGIDSLGELVQLTRDELRSLRNIGRKSAKEIEDAVVARGFCLGMDVSSVKKPVLLRQCNWCGQYHVRTESRALCEKHVACGGRVR